MSKPAGTQIQYMESAKEAAAMYVSLLKALLVTLGLALLYQLGDLLPYTRKPLSRCVLHAVMGLTLLLIANAVGSLFGLGLGLNAITLPVSAGLGVPGVALLWAIRYIL